MRISGALLALVLGACASAAGAQAPPARPEPPSMQDILDHSLASDWRPLDPANTLYMDLPAGRVIIELAADFSPAHVANVRALAAAHYWDGAAITRSQDNYVVQWGRVEGDPHDRGAAQAHLADAEYERAIGDLPFTRLPDPDNYAPQTGFTAGFPVARGGGKTWMTHCYGIVGVGRDNPPDNGDGSELYVVIGQAPRHLDRNLALVGRVVQGMELLSTLKRGTGALGFYETPAERTSIRIRLASDVPAAERVNLEALRTESTTFRTLMESRRNRRESFFVEPTGHINVCNVPIPVRAVR